MQSEHKGNLKDIIKTEALSLGFSNVGFCSANNNFGYEKFQSWINAGFSGGMTYLARNDTLRKRQDLHLLLADVKTIISFALSYSSVINQPGLDTTPTISSYAHGTDYHLIIPDLLEILAARIQESLPEMEFHHKIFTDSSPVLERSIAQLAGLGWIGKNSCIIHPKLGSYFFLAEMFINIELQPSNPFENDFCGSCTRCIENCPTACILPDRTIDARRCISYLTIENRDEIPEELRAPLGQWIFGCDICQQVCPWNQRLADVNIHPSLQPLPVIENFDAWKILLLNEDQFKSIFKHSPLLRTKLWGIKRNILNAIGNSGDADHLDDLQAFIASEENPLLLEHARWAIKNLMNT